MSKTVCMTWEEICPPYVMSTGPLVPNAIEKTAKRVKPVGEGKPFCDGRYRLHEGRYYADDVANQRSIDHRDIALVATLDGESVAMISGMDFWVSPMHRRSITGIDLAVEIWMAHGLKRGLDKPLNQYASEKRPVPMTEATLKVAKRAYLLLIERGHVVLPEGYTPPFTRDDC